MRKVALKEKRELDEKNQEDSISDEESCIGDRTKPDRIRKLRDMYYDSNNRRLKFTAAWFGYDKKGDTTEEIENLEVHLAEDDPAYVESIRKYIFVYFLFLYIHQFTMCFQITQVK